LNGIFITATDTEAGKTIVTGMLANYLLQKKLNVVTQKWIQTGSNDSAGDIDTHLKLMKKTKSNFKNYLPLMTPYSFKLPASPHLAAKKENKNINSNKIKQSFKKLSDNFDFVLVEGIGGALVPVNTKSLVIDIAKDLSLDVILVAQNKLGAINHTLLTVEALKKRNFNILGIIFNNIARIRNPSILQDNPNIIKSLSKQNVLGTIPWSNNKSLLQKAFNPIGRKIYAQLKRKYQ